VKLSQIRVEIIEEADIATLKTSIDTFLRSSSGSERVAVGEPPIQFVAYSGVYIAFITYTIG